MRTVWWLAVVISASLMSVFLSQWGVLDPARNLSMGAMMPLERQLRQIAGEPRDFLKGLLNRGDVVRENRRLKEEVERLQGELAAQADAQARIRGLEEALGVKQSLPDKELLVANVIARDPSGFKRAVAIDRGRNNGVEEGMVVLSKGGSLAGAVSKAYDNFAWVRLITDPGSAVNAQAEAGGAGQEETQVRAVASGDLGQALVLDLLPADAAVQEGAAVTTSGLGGNYPRALLIGHIEKLDQRPQAPFKKATIEPAAPLGSLDVLLVLTNFRPARLSAP